MVHMNVFRILGDVSHTLSKCILIWQIHANKSAEGTHFPAFQLPPDKSDALYILVFITRYLDLFWEPPWASYWNFVLKNFYIWTSLYIIAIMWRWYPRTREKEKAWRLGAICLGVATVLGPAMSAIFERKHIKLTKVLWSFSIILESVCVLPQLLLLRQTNVPTVIDSFYLLTLGSYRAFYIGNWIVRAADKDDHPHASHPIAIIFGIVQTALYLDFAWVYYSRQRVKLRNGGVVDSDDLKHSWLLRGIFGRKAAGMNGDADEEERLAGDGTGSARSANRWGARAISVSADEALDDSQRKPDDDFAEILEEDDGDEDEEGVQDAVAGKGVLASPAGPSGGEAWGDEGRK
ncbi:MAG: hypothetical protein M1816_008169 [Peltula sp. TS41687]|nr:MAG: hypothetical protein M1816_008169 [Peltula sp. TS41687]